MREASIARQTAETKITLTLQLDGSGKADIQSGSGFLDHMLTLFARHGGFDLTLSCQGDTQVDDHHSVEDIGICLGLALHEALGEKRGIVRYGHIILPMDEALLLAAVDLSGRAHLSYDVTLPTQKVGSFDTELGEEFFLALCRNAQMTLHLQKLAGHNSHHILEGCFKAVARALKTAATQEAGSDAIPSTKGVL